MHDKIYASALSIGKYSHKCYHVNNLCLAWTYVLFGVFWTNLIVLYYLT